LAEPHSPSRPGEKSPQREAREPRVSPAWRGQMCKLRCIAHS
jgi:hypothetical protein